MSLQRGGRMFLGKYPVVLRMTSWANDLKIVRCISRTTPFQMMHHQNFRRGGIPTRLALSPASFNNPTPDAHHASLSPCVASFKKSSAAFLATVPQVIRAIGRKWTMETDFTPSAFVPSLQVLHSISVGARDAAKRLLTPSVLSIGFCEFLFTKLTYLNDRCQLAVRHAPMMPSSEVGTNICTATTETKIKHGVLVSFHSIILTQGVTYYNG